MLPDWVSCSRRLLCRIFLSFGRGRFGRILFERRNGTDTLRILPKASLFFLSASHRHYLLLRYYQTGVTSAGTSDPYAVVTHIATEAGKTPTVLGKTEVVENNLNPQWAKHFTFDYDLGTPCRLAVSVFHHKKNGSSESMGAAIFDVGQVLGARGSTKAKQLKGNGQIYMTVRKAEPAGTFRFKFKGQKVRGYRLTRESVF